MLLQTEPPQLCLGASLLGVLSHLIFFIRGEWHMQAPALVRIYSVLGFALFVVIYQLGFHNINASFKVTVLVVGSYAGGLFMSIVIYRKYFHRLRHFPGPWMAGATKFWHVWQCRKGQNHLVIERLRRQYGPIIRTGPEELTIIDAAVPRVIDGPKSPCSKPAWYDFLLPAVAINSTRNFQEHDARRRIWNRAFGNKEVRVYEERVFMYAEMLAKRIQELAQHEKPVVVTDWFYWFSFDIMGEFAFARSFDMLQDKRWHFAVDLLKRAFALLGTFSAVPWLAQVGFYIVPWIPIVRDWSALMQWCKTRMGERLMMQDEMSDVSQWLIDASRKRGSVEVDREWLNGDAIAVIVAGSDTVATTLVFLFYELARSRTQQRKLYSELRDVDIYDRDRLQRCSHLTAIIHETLRLHPPVPTGGYRQSPPEGIAINGTYIPGNVTIVAPRYSLGRLESSYESASVFIPERWTTQPELVKDVRGFSPFAQGRYNCVGKALAMSEMRIVIALLIRKFEVGLWENESGESLFTDLRDQFTAAPGKLRLRFRLRG